MEDQITIDFTKPVLDLTNENITTLDLDADSERVKAIILTQNPVDDMIFLTHFPKLSLLHSDSTMLHSFANIPVENLSQLQFLILRLNQLYNFDGLGENDSLQTLDVSFNEFTTGAEETIVSAFSSLKRICFGFPTNNPLNSKMITCSKTNLNSFSLFRKLFVERFYDDSQIFIAENNQFELSSVLFSFDVKGAKMIVDVKKTTEDAIQNHKLILTGYVIASGFEIIESSQQLMRLSQLIDKNIGELNVRTMFQYQQVEYPTQETNLNRNDIQAFKLYDQMLEQQLELMTNYNIVAIEMNKQIGIIMFNRKTGQICNFEETLVEQQKQIALKDGLKLRVARAGMDVTINKTGNPINTILNGQDTDFYVPKQKGKIVRNELQGGIYDKIFNSRINYYEKKIDETVDLSIASNDQTQPQVFNFAPRNTNPINDEILDIETDTTVDQSLKIDIHTAHSRNAYNEPSLNSYLSNSKLQTIHQPITQSIDAFQNTGNLIQLENMELFQQLQIVTRVNNPVTTIYATTQTHDQIISELQQLLNSLNINQQVEQVLSDIIVQFNYTPKQLIDYQGGLYIPLLINQQIPFKIQLRKLFEGHSFYLDRSCRSKHIYASVNEYGFFSEQAIFYKPKLTGVELSHDNDGVLIVKVKEDINGQEKTCLSDNILYSFYRNQKLVGQNSIGYLNLAENNIELDGLFKVVVNIMEGGVIVAELESTPLYLEVQ